MPKSRRQYKKKHRRIFLLAVLVACLVTSTYFMLSAKADENGYLAYQYTPRLQVETIWGDGNLPDDNIPVGTKISRTAAMYSSMFGPVVVPPKMSIVVSYYYPTYPGSKYVSFDGVTCSPTVRCVSVSWPNFDGDIVPGDLVPYEGSDHPGTMTIANFSYVHKYSICADMPSSLATTPPQTAVPLYTMNYTVTNNSKRFAFSDLIRYYVGGSCDVNGGQSGQWFKPEHFLSYICLNQNGFDGPFYDGTSRNSCFEAGNGIPAGNDDVKINGGLSNGSGTGASGGGQNGKGANTGSGESTSTSGQSGGSSATTRGNAPNTAPTTSPQGTSKNTKLEPSVFSDGLAYKPGSDADDELVSKAKAKTNTYLWIATGSIGFLLTAIAAVFVIKKIFF